MEGIGVQNRLNHDEWVGHIFTVQNVSKDKEQKIVLTVSLLKTINPLLRPPLSYAPPPCSPIFFISKFNKYIDCMTVLITHVADPVWLNNSCARRSDLLLIFDYKTSNFACLSFFTLRSTSLQRIALMRVHVRRANFTTKGWFPVSRNFYVRMSQKFTFAIHKRSLVSVKVDPPSTSRCSALFILSLFYLRD